MRDAGTLNDFARRYWVMPIGFRKSSRRTSPGSTGSMSLIISPIPVPRRQVRPKAATFVLDGEDVAVEIRDPLLALDGELEVTERVPDIGLDAAPEERRILLDHVGRAGIAVALGHPGFQELVVERVEAPQIEGVGELPDQVGRPHQPRLGAGLVMLAVLRHRKARHLDEARR